MNLVQHPVIMDTFPEEIPQVRFARAISLLKERNRHCPGAPHLILSMDLFPGEFYCSITVFFPSLQKDEEERRCLQCLFPKKLEENEPQPIYPTQGSDHSTVGLEAVGIHRERPG